MVSGDGAWRERLLPSAGVIYAGHNSRNPLPPLLSPQVKCPVVPPAWQDPLGWGGALGPWCLAPSAPCLFWAPWGSGARQRLSDLLQPGLLRACGSSPQERMRSCAPRELASRFAGGKRLHRAGCEGLATQGWPWRLVPFILSPSACDRHP